MSAAVASHQPQVPVGVRLRTINAILLLALLAVGFVAWRALESQQGIAATVANIARAQQLHLDADQLHDALRADVYGALLATGELVAGPDELREQVQDDGERLLASLESLESMELGPKLSADFRAIRPVAEEFVALAGRITDLALQDRPAAVAGLRVFNRSFRDLGLLMGVATTDLEWEINRAEARSEALSVQAKRWLTLAGLLAAVLASALVILIARSIRRAVFGIRNAATRLAAGDLSVRSPVTGEDELGQISSALNQMAESLQEVFTRLRSDAERDAFSKQLADALEMADTENDVGDVVSRAMSRVSPVTTMELLLADSSRAHLERAAAHPLAGPPGCGVESPFSCPAVRRGQPMVYADSEALNACSRLAGRSCGAVAAVCVPVSFMGRALGVLHTAAPREEPLDEGQVAQLKALGVQAGMRIGTVRAFESTQLQANTDSLTGLQNRRALESAVRRLRRAGRDYAFVLADLDHFKRLNDTHGHEAGDRCLRVFAEALRRAIRHGDLAARWGGEEFCLLLPDASAGQAMEAAERVRSELAQAVLPLGSMSFTCSLGISDSRMSDDFETVARIADDALYRSKEAGRNRSTVGSAAHVSPAMTRRDIDPDQTAALQADLLVG